MLGVRLSPERFGMSLQEIKTVSQQLIDTEQIDFLDISLWDSFKLPEEEEYQSKSLLAHFTELDFKNVLFTVAGKIYSSANVTAVLNAGADFVSIGHSAILHHDFPVKVMADSEFTPAQIPVTAEYLRQEGLGDQFISYMKRWDGFVCD